MATPSPFHSGETEVQTRMGVREAIEPFARRVVRDYLPEQHRAFYAQLPFLVVAGRDGAARPWATVLAAPSGVADSPDPHSLDLHALPLPGDALEESFAPGADLGILGIEFHTRRRNRVNGRIVNRDSRGARLRVDQSFGNCPQFIHARDWETQATGTASPARRSEKLDPRQQAWIGGADTFFVATGYRASGEQAAYGMDASHRGGAAGFVQVLDATTLAWPDYAGNNHYNTLGNLVMDARIGLLFVDFATGSLLQLNGTARIDWTPDEARWPGAQRVVMVSIEAVVELPAALPLRWRAPAPLTLEVVAVEDESRDVKSFWFQRADGAPLPPFIAGQHVSVTVPVDGRPEVRSYSLSSSPQDSRWRISVKRHAEGRVSRVLHDHLAAGGQLRAAPPAGDFCLEAGDAPLLLIGAGVGVTPLVSMLAAAVAEGRAVSFILAARNRDEAPLAAEIAALAAGSQARLTRVFSQPRTNARASGHDEHTGRLNAALLATLIPSRECAVYLCGPTAFVTDVSAWLVAAGVAPENIHSESFG
ncbi:MAG: pyridoxamine 5'-phosphate oxidase family protein [Gammaproteobacteria bacterium]|nr:pyridoxamine 5'-phosphate oxidase family protein [Gammaproteobacteria bacterium]